MKGRFRPGISGVRGGRLMGYSVDEVIVEGPGVGIRVKACAGSRGSVVANREAVFAQRAVVPVAEIRAESSRDRG